MSGPQPMPERPEAVGDEPGPGRESPAERPGENWAKRPLSRRGLLARLAMGSAAAGAAAVLGAAVYEEATRSSQNGEVGSSSSLTEVPRLHQFVAAASALTSGGAQVFRSRPDLRPPGIIVDVRAQHPATDVVLTDSHSGPAQQGP